MAQPIVMAHFILQVRNILFLISIVFNSLLLFPSDSPYPVTNVRYNSEFGLHNFTILLEWDYPAYDGGTPITHYSILINGGIQQYHVVSTRTHEVQLLYSKPVNVSIIAHNCVGSSDVVSMQLFAGINKCFTSKM